MIPRKVSRTVIPPRLSIVGDTDSPIERRAWAKYLRTQASWCESVAQLSFDVSPELARELAKMLDKSADEMETDRG